VAADAFGFVHNGITLAVNLREGDALVRAVFAGDVAEVALDALRVINARDRLVVEIEIAPVGHTTCARADDLAHARVAFVVQVVRQSVNQVFDDAIAVVHDGGADLHGGCADQQELGRVAPRRDPADAADGDAHYRDA